MLYWILKIQSNLQIVLYEFHVLENFQSDKKIDKIFKNVTSFYKNSVISNERKRLNLSFLKDFNTYGINWEKIYIQWNDKNPRQEQSN